ncbi:hypothetical protein C8Q73DRAFT_685677, partial [Cubamyces lactineus]
MSKYHLIFTWSLVQLVYGRMWRIPWSCTTRYVHAIMQWQAMVLPLSTSDQSRILESNTVIFTGSDRTATAVNASIFIIPKGRRD